MTSLNLRLQTFSDRHAAHFQTFETRRSKVGRIELSERTPTGRVHFGPAGEHLDVCVFSGEGLAVRDTRLGTVMEVLPIDVDQRKLERLAELGELGIELTPKGDTTQVTLTHLSDPGGGYTFAYKPGVTAARGSWKSVPSLTITLHLSSGDSLPGA